MKRIFNVTLLTLVLIVCGVGSAMAQWSFEFTCDDCSCCPPEGTQFHVVYKDDGINHLNTDQLTLFVDYDDDSLNAIVNPHYPLDPGWTDMGSGDQGDRAVITGVNLSTSSVLIDGYVVADITLSGSGMINWDYTDQSFLVGDVAASTELDGIYLDSNAYLWPNSGVPFPPIPEIVTIVLLSIGISIIGAYVWFKRHYLLKKRLSTYLTSLLTVTLFLICLLGVYVVQAQNSNVTITVHPEGNARPDNSDYPMTVKYYSPDSWTGTELSGSPMYVFSGTPVYDSGNDHVQWIVGPIASGTYDITVQDDHSLENVLNDIYISTPTDSIDIGTLLEGDSIRDENNIVNAWDFVSLHDNWLSFSNNTDFNDDGIVNGYDFTCLKRNWLQSGPICINCP